MQTKRPIKSKAIEVEVEVEENLDASNQLVDELDANGEFEEREDGYVRIYTTKKEIVPGVNVDFKYFRVYLTEDKTTSLLFEEPATRQFMRIAEEGVGQNQQKVLLEFVSTLSCGEIEANMALLNRLPIKFQYRIIRTIEHITGAKGTKII